MKYALPFMIIVVLLASCAKDSQGPKPVLEMNADSILTGPVQAGLAGFPAALINAKTTTRVFSVNFVSKPSNIPNTTDTLFLSKDVNITLSIDDDAVQDNFKNDAVTRTLIPENAYHINAMTSVIRANSSRAVFYITFDSKKFDPKARYILPITLSNDDGLSVLADHDHIYFHTN